MRTISILLGGLLAAVSLTGCNEKSGGEPQKYEYLVLTEQSIDRLIYKTWLDQGIAKAMPDGKMQILDVTRANSEVTMPAILNAFGDKGWRLSGVNPSKLYIFCREKVEGREPEKAPAVKKEAAPAETKPAPPAKTEAVPSAPAAQPASKPEPKADAKPAPAPAPKAAESKPVPMPKAPETDKPAGPPAPKG